MQLTTVGRAIGQGAREAQRLAWGAGDPEVGKRRHTLKSVKALRESERSWDRGAFGHQPGHLLPLGEGWERKGVSWPQDSPFGADPAQIPPSPASAGKGPVEARASRPGGGTEEGEPHLGAMAHRARSAPGGIPGGRRHGGPHSGLLGREGTGGEGSQLSGQEGRREGPRET